MNCFLFENILKKIKKKIMSTQTYSAQSPHAGWLSTAVQLTHFACRVNLNIPFTKIVIKSIQKSLNIQFKKVLSNP
jgi:hypothetical protein